MRLDGENWDGGLKNDIVGVVFSFLLCFWSYIIVYVFDLLWYCLFFFFGVERDCLKFFFF